MNDAKTFDRIVDQVIALADAAAKEESERHPDGVALDPWNIAELLHEPPAFRELKAYLQERSQLELLALESVMYMGRDRDPDRPEIDGVLADFQFAAHEQEARERALDKLLEKTPALADYLRSGVLVVEAWGLTFDQLFAAAISSPREPPVA